MAEAVAPTSPTAVAELLGTAGAPTLGGSTINVTGGVTDLHNAINGLGAFAGQGALNVNGSHKGNTYVVPVGVNYNPPTLPLNATTGWTCIRSASGSLPAAGTQITPAHDAFLFNVRGPAGAVLGTPAWEIGDTRGWWFVGMDLTHGNAARHLEVLRDVGRRMIYERCHIHGVAGTGSQADRGVRVFGGDWQMWDSLVDECKTTDSEAQAIWFSIYGTHASGYSRYHMENTRFEGAGENVLFCDQDTYQPARDVTMKRCHVIAPIRWFKFLANGVTANPAWDLGLNAAGTTPWAQKNRLETKWIQRALFKGNTIENHHKNLGQDAMVIFEGDALTAGNPSGPGSFNALDLMYESNLHINAGAFWLSIGVNGTGTLPHNRIAIVNNLAFTSGPGLSVLRTCHNLRVEHNSEMPSTGEFAARISGWSSPALVSDNATFKRNLWMGTGWAIYINDNVQATSDAGLNPIFPTAGANARVFAENAQVGGSTPITGFAAYANAAAVGLNTTTGRLAAGSVLMPGGAGAPSDGLPMGVDFDSPNGLLAAQAGTSIPSSTFSFVQTAATLTVVFTNTSSGAPFTAHAWTFFATNGTTVLGTSVLPDPSFTYPASGSYNVRHQVNNGNGPGLIVNQAITVLPIGTTPTITITSPTSATTWPVTSPTITLTGSSTDMTSGTWSNSAAGASPASGVLTSTNPWSTPVINLVEGANPITVTAFNINAATPGQDVLTVTYTVPAPTPGAAPVYQAVGTPQAGVGALSVTWPALQTNDVGLLFVETANEVVATPSGWAIVTNAPQGLGTGGAAGATRLSAFWKRAAASEAAVTVADAGDHQVAFILTARGCNPTGNPWDVTAGDTLTPANSVVTFPSVTTAVVNTLNVYAYAWDNASTDPGVNSAWGTVIRRALAGTVLGTGGGLAVGTETVAAIGATGTRVTGQDVAGIQARMTIALRGVPLGSGAPTIALTSPAGPTHPASSTPLTVTGTATDDVAVTSVTWTNDAAGASPASGSAQVTGTTSATWSATIPLMPGLNGLNFTVHDSSAITQSVPLAVTYTEPPLAVPLPPQLMRGFGAARGVASTDTIQTPLATHVAQRTRMFWMRREETGLPRVVFTKSTQAIPSLTERFALGVDGGISTLHWQRQWSGGTADWYCTAPAAGTRFCVVIKYDSGAVANVPTIKINNVVQPITTVRQPAGGETVVTNAAGYMLGNQPGAGGSVGGDLAKWTVYNRLTSDAEDTDFIEGDNPMTIGVAPVAYHVLDGTVATEPDAVTSTVSVVTGTLPIDYDPPVVVPPTVTIAVTSGNPAGNVAYQATATVVGAAHRVEFYKDTVPATLEELVSTDLTAPYTMFPVPTLLGPGPHALIAKVFAAPTGAADDTDQTVVTEPSVATGTWTVKREICDRVAGATSYKWYVDGSLDQTITQPATGNPEVTFTFAGADTDKLFEYSSVTGGVESAKAAVKDHFTDPVASAIEGLREISRTYDGTNWLVSYRWNRKPPPALSYNFYREGSLIENILQPASGNPTYVDTFTGAAVEKTISVSAVYAGPTEGPRAAKKFSYLAPATNAPKGGQELSRVFTP